MKDLLVLLSFLLPTHLVFLFQVCLTITSRKNSSENFGPFGATNGPPALFGGKKGELSVGGCLLNES